MLLTLLAFDLAHAHPWLHPILSAIFPIDDVPIPMRCATPTQVRQRALIEALAAYAEECPRCHGPNDHGDECSDYYATKRAGSFPVLDPRD